jgi:hypothetical protein
MEVKPTESFSNDQYQQRDNSCLDDLKETHDSCCEKTTKSKDEFVE